MQIANKELQGQVDYVTISVTHHIFTCIQYMRAPELIAPLIKKNYNLEKGLYFINIAQIVINVMFKHIGKHYTVM